MILTLGCGGAEGGWYWGNLRAGGGPISNVAGFGLGDGGGC